MHEEWILKTRPERLVIHRDEPDPYPEGVVEANEDACGVGTWVVRIKHTKLCQYIDSAYGAARKWPGGWVYIDLFCGPGRIRMVGESNTRPGGAVAAWRQSQISGTPFSKVLIGDLNEKKLADCERRLQLVGAPVKAFNLAAVDSVKAMVREVPRGALCLAYVDPYKIGALAFDIFRILAEHDVDIVVNFFTSDLRRNVDTARDELNPGWRMRLAGQMNKSSLAAAWFEDWQQQVKGLGFRMAKSMQTVENSKNSELYRLVFFAKNDFPLGLWEDNTANPTGDLFD